MTQPTHQNCEHQAEGWCLKCVQALAVDRDSYKLAYETQLQVTVTARQAVADIVIERDKLQQIIPTVTYPAGTQLWSNFQDDEATPVETPPLIQQKRQKQADEMHDWIAKSIAALLEKRAALEMLPKNLVIECIICGGASPDPDHCGCEGVCTVEFALLFIDGELNTLSK